MVSEGKIILFFLAPVFFIVKKCIASSLSIFVLGFNFNGFEPGEIMTMEFPLSVFELFGGKTLFIGSFLVIKDKKKSVQVHIFETRLWVDASSGEYLTFYTHFGCCWWIVVLSINLYRLLCHVFKASFEHFFEGRTLQNLFLLLMLLHHKVDCGEIAENLV